MIQDNVPLEIIFYGWDNYKTHVFFKY